MPPVRRRALAAGGLAETGPALAAYLRKVDVASYETTGEEVAAAVAEVGEEAVFEATVAVALGAARRGLDAALAALGEDS